MKGQKRKDTLPRVLNKTGGSFFDPKVQILLEELRPTEDFLKPLSEQDRLRQSAFPIEAYDFTDALASTWRPQRVAEDWAYYYSIQPEIMADLLVAVTKYHHMPENEMALTRKVSEVEANMVGNFRNYLSGSLRLPTWAEVAKALCCPGITEDRIRAKEFYVERKRRKAILDKWKVSIEAYFSVIQAEAGQR